MKKILIARELKNLFPDQGSLFDRKDLQVFTAATNDEAKRICAREKVDAVITSLDMPGMRTEDMLESIRTDPELRHVSVIVACQDTLANRERCKRCRVNAVLTLPVDPGVLQLTMQKLLNVAPRMLYRAALAVALEGKYSNRPVPFWTENISASGMLIKAEEPLSKGAGLFLSFFLPDGTHISGYGEIVRVETLKTVSQMYLYGVKFTNINKDAVAAIEKVTRLMNQRKA
jgi:CheY-like chemotaxis protein